MKVKLDRALFQELMAFSPKEADLTEEILVMGEA